MAVTSIISEARKRRIMGILKLNFAR
jgi:hypothetical protein